MRALKFAVIAMGVLLVSGFAVLVFGFIQLASTPSSELPEIAEVPLDRLGLPASVRIVSLAGVADRLAVLFETGEGEQRLLMIDPDLLLDTAGDDR